MSYGVMTSAKRAEGSSLDRARALRRAGQNAEAAELLQEWLRAYPNDVDALMEWGNFLKACGQYAEALAPLQEAARLAPGQAAMWLNLGVALLELSRTDEAIAAFDRAVTLEPRRPDALNILGHALLVRGEPTRAAHYFERALKFKADYAPALDNLGRVRKSQGRSSEAIALHRRALSAGAGAATGSNLLYTLNLVPGISPDEIFAEHQRWGAAQPAALPLPPRPAAALRRRIRVGYVSPDFCSHAVAYFIEGVLAGHDRKRFDIICYSDVRAPDATTARLRALVENWRDISVLKDDVVLSQIRGDEIDILVDLAGHTARNRLGVFARRAAPVQVTWIGYPNTTGLATMDYRITDAISDPVGQTERWHSEKLLRLPGPFSLYRPPTDAPDVFSPLPATLRRCVTFGCFNHLAKIHPATIEVWGRILTRIPTAKLMLKTRGVDQATRQRIFAALEERGVSEERVEIISSGLSVRDHLTLYGRVDIGLDSFPYNGTTTTCEALWMGVPMVTLAGQTHVSRVGASILSHVGFFEGIATTVDDYVERAVGLAADLTTLANIRAGLRARMRASSLVDQRSFLTALEAAWEQIAKK